MTNASVGSLPSEELTESSPNLSTPKGIHSIGRKLHRIIPHIKRSSKEQAESLQSPKIASLTNNETLDSNLESSEECKFPSLSSSPISPSSLGISFTVSASNLESSDSSSTKLRKNLSSLNLPKRSNTLSLLRSRPTSPQDSVTSPRRPNRSVRSLSMSSRSSPSDPPSRTSSGIFSSAWSESTDSPTSPVQRRLPNSSAKYNVTPASFLPKELQQSNWCLNSKYSVVKNLIRAKVVGKGATATVKTVQSSTKQVYAAKVHARNNSSEAGSSLEYYSGLADEFVLAKKLNHRNIIGVVDLLVDSNGCWCSVMEFCDSGDLFSLIASYKQENKHMPREERNCLFKQLLQGVDYLHQHGIAHRDIKPENLLLTSKGCLKIADLGVCEVLFDPEDGLEHGVKLSSGLSGSEPYISPEVFKTKEAGGRYDARLLDTWSCAVVYINLALNGGLFSKAEESDFSYVRFTEELERFWELEEHVEKFIMSISGEETDSDMSSFGGSPSNASKRESLLNVKDESKPLFYFNEFGEAGKKIIARMLSPDPKDRPQVSKLVHSYFIRKIGMCIGPDPSEAAEATVNTNGIVKDQFIIRNHSHRPPPKSQKPIAMGTLKA
jgi:serine/threonine protein kinase